jgi:hypothetical protein
MTVVAGLIAHERGAGNVRRRSDVAIKSRARYEDNRDNRDADGERRIATQALRRDVMRFVRHRFNAIGRHDVA